MDANARFQRAAAAYQAGRADAARDDLLQVTRLMPAAAQAWHLLALCERRRGDLPAALAAFSRARALAPRDPAVLSNSANALAATGDAAAAVRLYREAVRLKPDFGDAWLNLGITLGDLDRAEDALQALERAHRLMPNSAKVWSALGLQLRRLGQHDRAADALDAALRLDPKHVRAAGGRALVEGERGGAQARALFARARALAPEDDALLLAEANARAAAGDDDADAELARVVAARPEWVEGQLELAKLRWTLGQGADATRDLDAALITRPADAALWEARLALARQAGDLDAANRIAASARAAVGDQPMLLRMHAETLLEQGLLSDAEEMLSRLPKDGGSLITQARLRLRARDPAAAGSALERVVAEQPRNQLAWALLATAWRVAADPRAAWLLERGGLWGRFPLEIGPDELTGIAAHVRALHRMRVHPIDQSLRGGTQTVGSLFLRSDPPVARLRHAIEAAIKRYVDALPSMGQGHPLLDQPRQGWRFTGSWSVRLTGGGFHVAHVHPEGWISSACYLALPAGRQGEEGWLALGEPPPELALDLAPLAMIEPQQGTVALFPSFLWHGTRPFREGERLTVAFDVAAGG